MSYEQELRVHAYALMCNDNFSLKEALAMACKDQELKGRYFITPLALERPSGPSRGVSCPFQDTSMAPYNPPPKAQKNGRNGSKGGGGGAKGGKAGGKSGGKSSGKAGGKGKKNRGCARATPDGKGICFGFNAGSCNAPDCKFAHVCGVCFKAGVNMHNCSCN